MEKFAERVMVWYDANRRPLPWRETRDAYAIWVSEIILQQTRVAQGLDYWRRFMETFPTVEALAAADEEQVLLLWQGLGYYSRARNMHAAARQIVAMGGFPRTPEGILYLKGVGEYTAAAIGSFAFDLPMVAVDGNVMRVLSRAFGIDEPIDSTRGRHTLKDLAQMLLPKDDAARFNQAMMEFGALQCVPSRPNCLDCPIADMCLALKQGRVDRLPVKEHKTKVRDRWLHYFLITGQRPVGDGVMTTEIYLHKRTDDDIWHNLYELPLRELPFEQEEEGSFPVRHIRHQLSHQTLHATLYVNRTDAPLPEKEGFIVVDINHLADYAMPRLMELLLDGIEL